MECSIVICTRNRAHSLRETLGALRQQQFSGGALEIVVVDNGSTDHTGEVVEALSQSPGHPLRYIHESQPGLSHARNCGVRNARGEIVVFIDDDASPLSRHWAERLVAAYDDPEVAAAGGDLLPQWPAGGRPSWLHERLLPPLGLTRFGLAQSARLRYPNYPWGANISYRKGEIEQLGGFCERLGWSPDGPTIAGEETELNLRLERAGRKILYVPEAVVEHRIAPEKLTGQWFMHRAAAQGRSEAAIDRLQASLPRLLFELSRRCAQLLLCSVAAALFCMAGERRRGLFCRYQLRASAHYLLHGMGAKIAGVECGRGSYDQG